MGGYYVNPNRQSSGDYEVHLQGCYWLSLVSGPVYLGWFSSCAPAVATAANLGYRPANGCYYCARACHTG